MKNNSILLLALCLFAISATVNAQAISSSQLGVEVESNLPQAPELGDPLVRFSEPTHPRLNRRERRALARKSK